MTTKNDLGKFTDKDLDREIAVEKLKTIQPNYYLADLLREKIKRLGFGIKDTPNGPIVYAIPRIH